MDEYPNSPSLVAVCIPITLLTTIAFILSILITKQNGPPFWVMLIAYFVVNDLLILAVAFRIYQINTRNEKKK